VTTSWVISKITVRLDVLNILRIHYIGLFFVFHIISLFNVDQLIHLATTITPVHNAFLQFKPNNGMVIKVVVEVAHAAYLLVRHAVGENQSRVVDGAEVARQYFEGLKVD